MTIRHLKVFAAVCETGSVTKAAELLHTAQPAVSQTIADIEKYYNVVLFDRINQRLLLTGEGKELLLRAKNVLSSFDEFEAVAFKAADSPEVRIGASLTIATTFLPNIMLYIKTQFPGVKLFTAINNAYEIQRGILDGEIDFAIIEGNPTQSSMCAHEFFSDKLRIVCGYNYDTKTDMTVQELAKCPLLLREKGSSSRDHLETVFNAECVSCTPAMESISNQAIIVAARENFGIAVLPEGLVKKSLQRKVLKEITLTGVELRRNSNVIWHKNKKYGEIQKKIFDYCCNYASLGTP